MDLDANVYVWQREFSFNFDLVTFMDSLYAPQEMLNTFILEAKPHHPYIEEVLKQLWSYDE